MRWAGLDIKTKGFVFPIPMNANHKNGVNKLEIVLRAIKESSGRSRERVLKMLSAGTPVGLQNRNRFSQLTDLEKGALRRVCHEQLCDDRKAGVFGALYCMKSEISCRKSMSPMLCELTQYLRIHGVSEPGIFRREGRRAVYKQIVDSLVANAPLNYEDYSILELASAMKSYIRDYLDGFFDPRVLGKIFKSITQSDSEETDMLCRYLIFSLGSVRRQCLIGIKELLTTIDTNRSSSKMPLDSLCNIFCLTMTPQEMFKKINVIPNAVVFFKTLMRIDMEDVSPVQRSLHMRPWL